MLFVGGARQPEFAGHLLGGDLLRDLIVAVLEGEYEGLHLLSGEATEERARGDEHRLFDRPRGDGAARDDLDLAVRLYRSEGLPHVPLAEGDDPVMLPTSLVDAGLELQAVVLLEDRAHGGGDVRTAAVPDHDLEVPVAVRLAHDLRLQSLLDGLEVLPDGVEDGGVVGGDLQDVQLRVAPR